MDVWIFQGLCSSDAGALTWPDLLLAGAGGIAMALRFLSFEDSTNTFPGTPVPS